MRFMYYGKDGGSNSGVWGFWFIEIKWLFSVVLLKFTPDNREEYHSHAFNALTWWLKGSVTELFPNGRSIKWAPSVFPKYTPRNNVHKIITSKPTYALSIRGPWCDTWFEVNTISNKKVTLTNHRVVVNEEILK